MFIIVEPLPLCAVGSIAIYVLPVVCAVVEPALPPPTVAAGLQSPAQKPKVFPLPDIKDTFVPLSILKEFVVPFKSSLKVGVALFIPNEVAMFTLFVAICRSLSLPAPSCNAVTVEVNVD